jgi:hypothetical protein
VSVNSVLRECASDLLETEPTVTVEQVVACAYRRHGDVFESEAERLVLQSARTIVAKLMRELTEDDDQQTLPGLNLPSAIAVRTVDGTYYVRADKATWTELLAGRELRTDNVTAAQVKLDAYNNTLDVLRPYMEHRPEVCLAEALREMALAS